MSRVITSPVKRWPGTLTLSDPLNFDQYIAWRDAVRRAAERAADLTIAQVVADEDLSVLLLPAMCNLIERCDLRGLPERLDVYTFPATPRVSSAALFAWLLKEVTALIADEEDVPKES